MKIQDMFSKFRSDANFQMIYFTYFTYINNILAVNPTIQLDLFSILNNFGIH